MKSNDVASQVKKTLENNLNIIHLEIIDDSEKHKKHKHFTHEKKYFTIKISAFEFENTPLLECHKMIYAYLADLIKTSIHAISIKVIRD